MIVTAIAILVFDPQIGEVHVAVEVGEIVFVRARFDLLFIAIRTAICIRATAIALVQPLLVLTLELVVQDDAFDVGATLLQPLGFAQVRTVDLGVVLHLARLLELGVEPLPILSIAFVPMRLERCLPRSVRTTATSLLPSIGIVRMSLSSRRCRRSPESGSASRP